MGTNYYRIPTEEEMLERKELLIKRVNDLDATNASNIKNKFRNIRKMDMSFSEGKNLWEEFTEDICVHLGKRSYGWKFCWNFHNNVYYSNKEELFQFIRRGRVVDEYGTEINVEEFIEMALEWFKEDGLVFNEKYEEEYLNNSILSGPEYYDRIIDGLRVTTATEFC